MLFKSKLERLDLRKLYRFNKDKNAFIIDISIDYYRDLYNDWDFSPFKRRDLDTELVSFIEESSEEIPLKYKVIINFFMPLEMRDLEKEKRSKGGLNNYFKYMLYKVEGDIVKHRIRAFKYTLTGSIFVLTAFTLQKFIKHWVYLSLLPEGFFIGGWVFMWEVFTILFFHNADRKVKLREYKRLMEAEVNYNYYTENYSYEELTLPTPSKKADKESATSKETKKD